MRTAALAFASFFLLASCTPTDDAEASGSAGMADETPQAAAVTDHTSGDRPIPIPATDLEWFDLDPDGAPGVQLATLWGDPGTGAFGAFMRLPAGFASPLHTHTNPMKVVFVSGTYVQQPDGGEEFRLGPGSYLMQPGGDYRHATSCDPAADCVFFVESDGAFDMFLAEDAPDPS